MARKTSQIVMGSESSYEGLVESAQKNKPDWWSCGKNTKAGDLLFFYIKKPKSEIVALAIASDDAKPDEEWRYGADIENIKLFEPISLEKMREVFPKWGWLERTRNLTYLDGLKEKKLLKLAGLKGRPDNASLVTISSIGAGFGTPQQNREAERAACQTVQTHFERLGYYVKSREKEKVGYDFDVRRKGEEKHIEVKGISGSRLRFPITANEVSCAKSDNKFCLAVVTNAKTAQKKVRLIIREHFLKHFHIKPLAFFAEAKSSLPA